MTDAEIIAYLKTGKPANFGVNGRNTDIMDLMHRLETEGLIVTTDCSTSQETRREARWIGPK